MFGGIHFGAFGGEPCVESVWLLVGENASPHMGASAVCPRELVAFELEREDPPRVSWPQSSGDGCGRLRSIPIVHRYTSEGFDADDSEGDDPALGLVDGHELGMAGEGE